MNNKAFIIPGLALVSVLGLLVYLHPEHRNIEPVKVVKIEPVNVTPAPVVIEETIKPEVKKAKKKGCTAAETEAYDWAFFNAYRANALSGKKQYSQGPNPCKKK